MNRIKGFDGLRAIAVTLVFLQHFTQLGRTIEMGSYGVWLFFVLSGFLIVRILHGERLAAEAGRTTPGAALGRFVWRRALRIWPIYYLVLAVFTVFAALGWAKDFPLGDAGWHFAYLSNVYFGHVVGDWTGRFGYLWSLAVEQQFYLLAAPAILFLPSRLARPLCIVVALVAVLQTFLLWAASPPIVIYTDTLSNFGVLAAGGLAGLLVPARTGEGARSWPALAWLGAIAATCLVFHAIDEMPRDQAMWIGGLPMELTALFGGLALASIHANQRSLLVRLLEWRPVAFFGAISYGFYLFHNLPPHWMITGFSHRLGMGVRAPESLEALVNFACAFALAALSWVLIEKPLLGLKGRVPPRLQLGAVEPAPARA